MVFIKNSGARKNLAQQNQKQKKKPFQKNIKAEESEDDDDLSDDDDVDLDSDQEDDNDIDLDSDEDDTDEVPKNVKLSLSANIKTPLKKAPVIAKQKGSAKGNLQKATPVQQKKNLATPAKMIGQDDDDDDEDNSGGEDDDSLEDEEDSGDDETELVVNKKKPTPSKPVQQSKPANANQVPQNSNQRKRKASESESSDPKRTKLAHLSPDQFAIEERRQKERDRRTLYLSQIPSSVTEEDLRAMSADIIDCRIPTAARGKKGKKKRPVVFAFLEFKSEAKAEENYAMLQSKKVGGQKIFVDYVGEKSAKLKTTKTDHLKNKLINRLKLFVAGLPPNCDISDVTKLFPKAKDVSLEPNKGPKKFAYVTFADEETAATVYKASENLEILGTKLTVLYATSHQRRKSKKKGNKQNKQKQQQKKEESDDEGSEEDDDDDDDDE